MSWNGNRGGGWSEKKGNEQGRNPWTGSPGGQDSNIEDFVRFLQGRMGFSSGGGNGFRILTVLFVIGFIIWFLTGFYTIGPAQQGIVLRFGKFVEITQPGINYHLPYPVEQVIKVNVTQQNQINIGFSSSLNSNRTGTTSRNIPAESIMLTGDENIVDIEFSIIWQIVNAPDYLFNLKNQNDVIRAISESAVREVVARTPVQDIITTQRDIVTQQVTTEIQKTLDAYGSGVLVTQLVLQRADPPAEVISAVRDVQSAQADQERLRNEGEAYRNRKLNQAEGQARRTRENADAYREERIMIADGESKRFRALIEQYQKNPELVRSRMYLETMEQVLSGMDKIILDQNVNSGVVPYLPLQEFTKKGGNN